MIADLLGLVILLALVIGAMATGIALVGEWIVARFGRRARWEKIREELGA